MQCLLDTTSSQAPKALVEVELERLMHDAHHDLASRGVNSKEYAAAPGFVS